MKTTFSLQHYFSFLIMGAFVLPLVISTNLRALSEEEVYYMAHNQGETYLYCDKDHSKMVEIIAEISKFDDDKDSPLWQFNEHIECGYSIGREEIIVETLEWAAMVLDKNCNRVDRDKFNEMQLNLNSVMQAVADDQLTVDVQSLLGTESFRGEKLKVYKPATFYKKAKFKDKVDFKHFVGFHGNGHFYKNLTIDDALTAGNEIVSCDLTVGCNFSMNDSVSPAIGNIIKNGVQFIHNFGEANTFVGANAGNFTLTGISNTGMGDFALQNNESGDGNVAVGVGALQENAGGDGNVAVGIFALEFNVYGSSNVALGSDALRENSFGSENTAVGATTLANSSTGSGNIALGCTAGNAFTSTESNNIDIGNVGVVGESGIIRIGTNATHTAAYVQGIYTSGITGVPVVVNIAGQLGVASSSAQFKRNIKNMDINSEDIYRLRPVTFEYKNDDANAMQYGLIAEEVADVFPSLVVHDKDGNPYTVRYQVLPMLLLNEVQKLHARMEAMAEDFGKRIADLEVAA